ncbi:MAG: hypothetical protein EOO73_01595 [Myxococcales bacterium]|nr:MAG: hypothetical protein EOO73_01595 [Myxococcales bacterium]
MSGFGFRLPVMCLIGMGLVGCSAAGESDSARPGADSDPTLSLNPGAQGSSGGKSNEPTRGGSEMQTVDEPDADHDDEDQTDEDSGPGGRCECAFDLPGIHIDHGDGGIAVSIDLPDAGMVVIETKDGSVTTSAGGVDIHGDVTIDLGADTDLPLADAQLHIGLQAAGGPTIAGNANITGSLLEGSGCGCEGSSLPVSVALELDGAAKLIDSDALAGIRLGLGLPAVRLDTKSLPAAAAEVMALANVKAELLTDGCSKLLELEAQLGAGAGSWSSLVPLTASGALDATATVLGGSLVTIALEGDVTLVGGALKSGATSLLSIELPRAVVTLDRNGAKLSGETTASLHPAFSLTGEALVTGEFTEEDWSLNVCGAVMTSLLGGVSLGSCVDVGKSGIEPCRLPAN